VKGPFRRQQPDVANDLLCSDQAAPHITEIFDAKQQIPVFPAEFSPAKEGVTDAVLSVEKKAVIRSKRQLF
jgi:hypothetical protein